MNTKVEDLIDKLDPSKGKCLFCGYYFPKSELHVMEMIDGIEKLICDVCQYDRFHPEEDFDEDR